MIASKQLRLSRHTGELAAAVPQVVAPLRLAGRVVGLGYAVPGAVIAVGILLPVGWLQAQRAEPIAAAARGATG